MKKSLLLAGVLLVGTTSVGVAVAATDLLEHHGGHERAGVAASFRDALRFAEDDHRRDGEHRRHHREHDDDEDDDEGGEDGGRGARPPVTGPTDPAAPVPDNGLFQGKARPKVEVN